MYDDLLDEAKEFYQIAKERVVITCGLYQNELSPRVLFSTREQAVVHGVEYLFTQKYKVK
jgi:hypothetical protein